MEWPAYRRYPRIEAYVPAQCTVSIPGVPSTSIEGKTHDLSPGGAMLLLPTCLPPHTRLTVRLAARPELRGQIAWAGKVLLTDLGAVIGHGVAFTRDLDVPAFKEILHGMQRQRHVRVPARFPVEYSDLEKSGTGTCLNMSQTGMFIATPEPLCVGQDILVHIAPPGLHHIFSLWSRVIWSNHLENTNSFPAGFGVRFAKLRAAEVTNLSTLLEELQLRDPAFAGESLASDAA